MALHWVQVALSHWAQVALHLTQAALNPVCISTRWLCTWGVGVSSKVLAGVCKQPLLLPSQALVGVPPEPE